MDENMVYIFQQYLIGREWVSRSPPSGCDQTSRSRQRAEEVLGGLAG